jgi:ABC-type branched-subunit amino acid transport system ATPase component
VGAVSRTEAADPAEIESFPRTPIVEVTDVARAFGGVAALDGVDLRVNRGDLVGLIGPNGAGKSTLFNAITGVLKPDRGRVVVDGVDVTGRPVHEVAAAGLARTFQTPRGFRSMTVLQNLTVVPATFREHLFGAFMPRRADEREARRRADEVLERIGLARLRDASYETLSVGQAHLLEIGRQLMREVKLLLLDEPTSGVVPSMQDDLADLLRGLNRDGVSIVVVEHNLGFVLPLVSRVHVMDFGRVIRSGPPDEIQRDPAVIAAYLGGEAT